MVKSIVKQKSYEFALQIVKICTQLRSDKHYEISSQLLRSGTAVGANVEEALAGQSRKDFFAKMSIASKEAREANYWLRLLKDSKICDGNGIHDLLDKLDEMIKILTSIVKKGVETQSLTKNSKLKT